MNSDAELVRQARSGHAPAYEELVRRWAARVAAVCHARAGRRAPVEDLVQEVLLRAYRGLPTLERADRFGAWICGIAVRTSLDWLKAKERTQVRFSDLGGNARPEEWLPAGPEPGAEEREESEVLLREVDRLPEAHRQVVLLYYYGELTYEEIADILDVSAATVNKRLTTARARLRSRLIRRV